MSNDSLPLIVIAAGGTGGHFFPAEALAQELLSRGRCRVALMTDQRAGKREQGVFAGHPQFILPGAGVAGKGAARKLRSGLALVRGALQARKILKEIGAQAVVGFGGYPSVPPIFGAGMLGRNRPVVVLHEGNAVLGQANRFLARFASAVATSFKEVAGLPDGLEPVMTGMPVRPDIEALYGSPYPDTAKEINVLVWAGSLGAKIFSAVVPQTLAALPQEIRSRLRVVQQCRKEDINAVRTIYEDAGIHATIDSFFTGVATHLGRAHLVIGRAGGSSVAEITMAGKPAIMVPLPIAASDEQSANAANLTDVKAGWVITQSDFTAKRLTDLLMPLLKEPERLRPAAQASHDLAQPGAVQRLADLIESFITRTPS